MKKLCFFSIVLLIIFSCEKYNNITDIGYSIYISNDSITTGINFYPIEIYENYNSIDTPDLKLHFVTTNSYFGGSLFCTKFVEKNELIVRFDSIQSSIISIPEPWSADAYVDLPEYVNKITLINGHVFDKYEVIISKEKVEIDSIVKNYTDVTYNKIFRYPENTFNFTCWTDSIDKNLCIDFLNILDNELLLVEYVFSGEGKIPFPYYTSTASNHYTAVFKYEKESDYDRAGELLKEFTLEQIPPDEGKSISLFGWNNKHFFSWTFY